MCDCTETRRLNNRIDALRWRLEKLEAETEASRKTVKTDGQDLTIGHYTSGGQIIIGGK